MQRAPQIAPQVLVDEQLTAQSSPHVTLQLGPLVHEKLQWSAQVASQLLAKLLHDGAHFVAFPQSRLHASFELFPHPHESAVHSSAGPPTLLLEHAIEKTTATENRKMIQRIAPGYGLRADAAEIFATLPRRSAMVRWSLRRRHCPARAVSRKFHGR